MERFLGMIAHTAVIIAIVTWVESYCADSFYSEDSVHKAFSFLVFLLSLHGGIILIIAD